MLDPSQYRLLDFGRGRKLEQFAGVCTDRPSPAAAGVVPANPGQWSCAAARYERTRGDRGQWHHDAVPPTWRFQHGPLTLQLRLTDFGHVGLFPEQAENWDWIARQVHAAGRPLKVLNLFAYTGSSTLAAAAEGAEVVHVDAARSTVNWARANAALSGLADRPIRWIVEDARKFVDRERKRGNRYDGLILDPPTYGHGPDRSAWKLTEHLPQLLRACGELLATQGAFALLTCHAPDKGPGELRQMLGESMPMPAGAGIESGELSLVSADGRALHSGVFARWAFTSPRNS
jgi:23S rRNA (cytosine1962-C5)-methyltransferase